MPWLARCFLVPLQIKHARAARQLEASQASEKSLAERATTLERDLADLSATSRARLHWLELAATDAGRRVEQLYAQLQASAPLDAHQLLVAKHAALQVGPATGIGTLHGHSTMLAFYDSRRSDLSMHAGQHVCVPVLGQRQRWQRQNKDILSDAPAGATLLPQVDYRRLMEERAQVVMDAEALIKLRDQLADMTLRFDQVSLPDTAGKTPAWKHALRNAAEWLWSCHYMHGTQPF
jgi:hypothetical protein